MAEERAFYNLKNNAYQTEGTEPPIFDFTLEEGGKNYPKYDGNKINLRLCSTRLRQVEFKLLCL